MISIGLTDQQGATPSNQYDAVSRGYQNGHSDMLITNRHIEFTGLAIELKTPNGRGSIQANQIEWLDRKMLDRCTILVSNDYDHIGKEIDEYFSKVRLICPLCITKPTFYKNRESLNRHIEGFHSRRQRSSAIEI